jgi:uncharacterized phage protein gp47/JayE
MANIIDSTGFNRERYQDLRAEKAQQYKDAFGNQELKTDVQSGVGQEISISTNAEDDLASRMQTLLSALDPTQAQGVLLSRLAIVMKKRRQDATSSTVTLSITADGAGATVPAGFQVANAAGNAVFETDSELVLSPSATGTVQATCVNFGAIEAIAGSLTTIKTPVFGVASVTNLSDASLGRSRETDTELRARCLNSSAGLSSTVIGISSAISNIDGVTALKVLENKTLTPSAEGIPAKSVFPIVENGADADIAKALVTSVAGGIGYTEPADIPAANIVSGTYEDPITGQEYTAYWARPVSPQIYVEVNLNKLASYPADGDARVKQAIEDWVIANMEFGEDLYASQLYCPVQEVEGAIITSLFVGLAPSPAGSVVNIDVYERASVLVADIDIP